MISKEELSTELIIGYDLCNDYSQISYFSVAHGEPKTISIAAGEEQFQIPTVLFKKKGADKWYFGEEAIQKAEGNENDLITDLLIKCKQQESVIIEEQEYEADFLLELFIKKTFGLFHYEGITKKIPDCIVFTVSNIDICIANALKKSAEAMQIPKEAVFIQDHEESFVEYTFHQKCELWNHNVILLEYTQNYLKSFELKINTKTTPITATIMMEDLGILLQPDLFLLPFETEKDKKHTTEELDHQIKEMLKNYFGNSLISTVFLCGEGFDGKWTKETLRFLCLGRRVFQGKNLYTKGACYFATKRALGKETEDCLLLGGNKIKYNIGLEVSDRGEKRYYSLATADQNWYDACKECELILDNETCVELRLTPIDHKETRIVIINLHDLPVRTNRTVRVLLQIKFQSVSIGTVIIKDLGFGEFFESSGKVWRHELQL